MGGLSRALARTAAPTGSVRAETCARGRVRTWLSPLPSSGEGQAALGSARAALGDPPSRPSAVAAESLFKN